MRESSRCPPVHRPPSCAASGPLCALLASAAQRLEQPCHTVQDSRKLSVHYLEAYRTALVAVLRLQFTRRALPGGQAGVLGMLRSNPALAQLLAADG